MAIKSELLKILNGERNSSTSLSEFYSLRDTQKAFDELSIAADVKHINLHGVDLEFEIFFSHKGIKYTFSGELMDMYMVVYKY